MTFALAKCMHTTVCSVLSYPGMATLKPGSYPCLSSHLSPALDISAGDLSALSSSFSMLLEWLCLLQAFKEREPPEKAAALHSEQPTSHQHRLDINLAEGYWISWCPPKWVAGLCHESDICCQHGDWLAVGQQHLGVWIIGTYYVLFFTSLPCEIATGEISVTKFTVLVGS